MAQAEDENELTLAEHTLLINSLRGGKEDSKIDSLYTAFWTLSKAFIDSLEKEKIAKKFTEGKAFEMFISVTSTPSSFHVLKPTETKVAFRSLPAEAQNLLMAAGELNMKLGKFEQAANADLSAQYMQAANQVSACIQELSTQMKKNETLTLERAAKLHMSAVQGILGSRFAVFTTGASQALQQITSQFKLDVHVDMSSIEELMKSLQEARRKIHNLRISFQPSSTTATPSYDAHDRKLALRMQKHQISQLRAVKTRDLRSDPVALAEALKKLRLEEQEADALLASAAQAPLQLPALSEKANNSEELLIFEKYLDELIETAHVLSAESAHIKESMESQVRKEMRASFESMREHAKNCIDSSQTKLQHLRAQTLKRYEEELKTTREAEKTIANELSLSSKLNRNISNALDLCAKAIAEAARQQKIERDVFTLNENKKKLHEVVLEMKSLV